jgi:hypothetical protein
MQHLVTLIVMCWIMRIVFQQFRGSHLEPFCFVVGVSVCPSCILFICQKEVEKDVSGNNSVIFGTVWPFLGS